MFQSLIINPVKIIIVSWNFLDSTFHKVTQSVVDSLPLPSASVLHPSQLLLAIAVAEVQ